MLDECKFIDSYERFENRLKENKTLFPCTHDKLCEMYYLIKAKLYRWTKPHEASSFCFDFTVPSIAESSNYITKRHGKRELEKDHLYESFDYMK